ncbi:hypothetical protein Goarm_012615, partial [Gossypium armourianum]|nr:hypothetical protein [Gossypium armourianum]
MAEKLIRLSPILVFNTLTGWKQLVFLEAFGSPNSRKRRCLWDALKVTFSGNGYPWMAVGDFNALLSPSEKKGGRVSGKRCSYFRDFVDSTGVHDFGFKCAPFTWSRGEVYERLDRAIGNYMWLASFSNYFVTHFLRLIADHRPLSNSLLQLDLEVRKELEQVMYHEELLWKQKAKYDWLSLGEWIFDEEALRHKAICFFKNLYSEDPGPMRGLTTSSFSQLEDGEALGSDRFHDTFFRVNGISWGFGLWIGQEYFCRGKIDPELNNTLIVLIPKIIANQFKLVFPRIIGQGQSGFIVWRSTTDNIIITQEVFHSMRVKQKSNNWFAIKIDLEKAYDRVSGRKVALVSWEDVCQPKDHGGLDFRKLYDHNTSFMLKLSYKLVADSKTLWAQRALTKVWPLIRENLLWSVRDGESVICSHDPWVLCVRLLVNMIPGHTNLDLDCIVNDMRLLTNVERVRRGLRHSSMCEGISWSNDDSVKVSYSWANHFALSGKALICSTQILTHCTHLVGNWACLNTDGSVRYGNDFAAVGGTVRNRNGKWILGILVDWGYDHMLIQTDSLEVAKFERWSISHISRGDNQETDNLVKLAHGRSHGLRIFE